MTRKATNKCWQNSDIHKMRVAYGHDFSTTNERVFVTPASVEPAPIKKQWVGAFFTIIGADQALHIIFLLWSGFSMGVI